MDAQPLFDPQYLPVVLITLFGFLALAWALLYPIWKFLNREEEVASKWTPDELARRMKEHREASGDGSPPSGQSRPSGGAEASPEGASPEGASPEGASEEAPDEDDTSPEAPPAASPGT